MSLSSLQLESNKLIRWKVEKESTIHRLTQMLDDSKTSLELNENTIRHLHEEATEIKRELKEVKEEKESLVTNQKRSETIFNFLENEVGKLSSVLSSQESIAESISSKVEKYEIELEKINNEVQKLNLNHETDVKDIKESLNVTTKNWENEKKNGEMIKEDFLALSKTSQESIDSLSSQVQDLSLQLTASQNNENELKSQIIEESFRISAYMTQIAELKTESETNVSKLAFCEQSLRKRDESIERLNKEVLELRESKDTIENNIKDLRIENQKKEIDLDHWKSVSEFSENANNLLRADLEEASSRFLSLKKDFEKRAEDKDEELLKLEETNNNYKEKIIEWEKKEREREEENRENIRKFSETNIKLGSICKEKEEKLKESNEKLLVLERLLSETSKSLSHIEAKCLEEREEGKRNLEAKESRCAQLLHIKNEEVKNYQKSISLVENDNYALRKRVEELEKYERSPPPAPSAPPPPPSYKSTLTPSSKLYDLSPVRKRTLQGGDITPPSRRSTTLKKSNLFFKSKGSTSVFEDVKRKKFFGEKNKEEEEETKEERSKKPSTYRNRVSVYQKKKSILDT